jgi:hemolysin activation/secretion protein
VNYRGISENNEFKLTRTLMRDANQKIGVSIKAFQRKSNNFIDDTEVLPQRRVVGGWDGTLNWKQFIHEAILDSSFTYRRGTGAFGAIPAPGTAFGEESAYFEMMTAEANLSWPMRWGAQRLRYNGTWRIQANQTPLTPQDRFAIGGRYTVRGYDGEAVLSAERGWLLRNDLSLPLAESNQELYFGLDHGEVSGKSSDLLVGKRLTGAVMGLRGVMQKLNYDVFVGGPVEKPDQFTTAGSTAGFSLSASF